MTKQELLNLIQEKQEQIAKGKDLNYTFECDGEEAYIGFEKMIKELN